VVLRNNSWLLLEVEGKQHHPNTNVLKLWPFLEAHQNLSVILVHAFEKNGRNRLSSRGKLAEWLAKKMRKTLRSRFRYFRIVVDPSSGQIEGTDSLAPVLAKFRQGSARGSR